nr:glia-derived nexin-like [Penaeus vannamei]
MPAHTLDFAMTETEDILRPVFSRPKCVGKVLDDKVKFTDFNRCGESSSLVTSQHIQNRDIRTHLKPRAQCESLPYKRADLFSRLTLILNNREKPSVNELVSPTNQPDTAAAYINAFFSAETRGKIPNIIQPSFLGGAKMVLTNAVYFKGIWKYPFKSQSTHKEFSGLEEVSRPGLEMPFRGDSASMVVLLPRCGRGSKTVEWLVRRLKPKRLALS